MVQPSLSQLAVHMVPLSRLLLLCPAVPVATTHPSTPPRAQSLAAATTRSLPTATEAAAAAAAVAASLQAATSASAATVVRSRRRVRGRD